MRDLYQNLDENGMNKVHRDFGSRRSGGEPSLRSGLDWICFLFSFEACDFNFLYFFSLLVILFLLPRHTPLVIFYPPPRCSTHLCFICLHPFPQRSIHPYLLFDFLGKAYPSHSPSLFFSFSFTHCLVLEPENMIARAGPNFFFEGVG